MSIAIKTSRFTTKIALSIIIAGNLLLATSNSFAGNREQARRIYDRLTGMVPSKAAIDDMVNTMTSSTAFDAAMDVIELDVPNNQPVNSTVFNSNFYNVTLKNWATPSTNDEQTAFAPLNDMSATMIGLIRDGRDFREVLYDNVIYVGNPSIAATNNNASSNQHYVTLENTNSDLSDTTVLQRQTNQAPFTGINAPAGVMTTRQAGKEFFYLGTNRAMFRYTMLNFLCNDLEALLDITRVPDKIRQDVSRSPGGDSSVFLSSCIGCHAGMDGMAAAFAYYEWNFNAANDPEGDNGSLGYNTAAVNFTVDDLQYNTRVQRKHLINPGNFPFGRVMQDDSWINYWRNGPNSNMGWGNPASIAGVSAADKGNTVGVGAASLGRELANSAAFARCQVRKAYRTVCFNDPDESTLSTITTSFTGTYGYDMRKVFAASAVSCMGN